MKLFAFGRLCAALVPTIIIEPSTFSFVTQHYNIKPHTHARTDSSSTNTNDSEKKRSNYSINSAIYCVDMLDNHIKTQTHKTTKHKHDS